MDVQNANKKRGRPSKYASAEEKAHADVERRRELRRKEAHEPEAGTISAEALIES
jgi:hypothetical protein